MFVRPDVRPVTGRLSIRHLPSHLGWAPSGFVAVALLLCVGCDAPESRVSDTELASRVQSELSREQGANALGIQVKSHDGVVTLRGDVANEDVAEELKDAAKGVDGVEEVRDELQVGMAGGSPPPVGSPPPGEEAPSDTLD